MGTCRPTVRMVCLAGCPCITPTPGWSNSGPRPTEGTALFWQCEAVWLATRPESSSAHGVIFTSCRLVSDRRSPRLPPGASGCHPDHP
jgi:hypothetical protein